MVRITVHTSESDYQKYLSFRLNKEGGTTGSGDTTIIDESSLSLFIFVFVFLGLLEGITTSQLVSLESELLILELQLIDLFACLPCLYKRLRDGDSFGRLGFGGHRTRTTRQKLSGWKDVSGTCEEKYAKKNGNEQKTCRML